MALGTTDKPQPNPQMPAHPVQEFVFDPNQPMDPVHLVRLYGDRADSLKEMRALALKAHEEAMASAEAATKAAAMPHPELPRGGSDDATHSRQATPRKEA